MTPREKTGDSDGNEGEQTKMKASKVKKSGEEKIKVHVQKGETSKGSSLNSMHVLTQIKKKEAHSKHRNICKRKHSQKMC